ncbi:MAG TPA: FtsH protease activity modulator HflK [Candidatus Marinimicrobia bacterium]|jgi:membrane protease subunit HflK|nr:FtsH protease activity modulator HflK [Candidatus Neomarinimicrobiota bacterium]MDP6229092.1 FtsH protease activity modulator HflK [Candidatus Neomarinimicrobiota bacterium]MDP7095357.1 FtsH protease activity modulator HflK [Candidatus Neomarinimicrobiota bacterium]MDP7165291.1 FtsH protease activity modulator HflK [Candidatus Neomarinimicrobiota bacterium]MDP7512385.1 FtsH protease activity modulator HflK [Candidatus Neomarinimicrobiota bacterium]|tara:strand:- start:1467 stop:2426 length:960 start_codon:yes stop_codon:yes gene_type:complete
MSPKRIIIGDKELSLPDLGLLPIISIGLILWLISGVYVVGPDEVGVVQTFGKHTRVAQSGLNYHFPFPIETVKTPKVTEVKRIEIGFRSMGKNQFRTIEKESLMLTGDENIVDAELIVQYKIKNAVNYLFNFVRPELTVREAAEASLRTIIGKHKIDEALTSGKFVVQEETKELLQSIMDKYGTGILIVAVQLQDVSPPKQVIAAFKDVASAKEDKNRMINQAEGYRNDVIPKARGEAQAMIREAEGFRESRIKRSEGDVAKFNAMLVEYKKAKDITRKRMYLETMEEILPNIEKYIIPESGGGNLLNLLNLNSEGGKK